MSAFLETLEKRTAAPTAETHPAWLALTDEERRWFLPVEALNELKAMLPDLQECAMPAASQEDWNAALLARRPEILITSWNAAKWPLPMELMQPPHGLQYVCHIGGSVRSLVPRAMLAAGLRVTNWGYATCPVVAECVLLLILSALRRATFYNLEMHRPEADGWQGSRCDQELCRSLHGRQVGLHGFGGVAQALVPMLRPFTKHIQSYAPGVPGALLARLGVSRCSSLDELFTTSEVVVELSGAPPASRHVITEELLRKLPPDAVFINSARGMLVDESALIRVASEGRIQVALDVYEREPLPLDSPLRHLSNVTLLPHVAGPTYDRRRDCGALAVTNVRRYLQGEPLDSEITLEVYDRST